MRYNSDSKARKVPQCKMGEVYMENKTGIYVPLITPFLENGEVDYAGLEKATKFVLAKGVDGIYALGGSAEFTLLSVEERKRCLECILASSGEKEVIVQVGSQSTRDSLELAEHAAAAGATMLSAVAPYYFGYDFSQIQTYFKQIAHATDLPLMIYNAAQARSYTLDEMRALLQDEKIRSVKYTGYNFYFLERLITEYRDKKFYTGADEAFLAGQAVGAHGAIGTTYNYFADRYVQIRKLFLQGENQAALDIVRKVNGVTQTLIASNSMLAATKYVMTLQGLDILPISRAPFTPLSEDYKRELKASYERSL